MHRLQESLVESGRSLQQSAKAPRTRRIFESFRRRSLPTAGHSICTASIPMHLLPVDQIRRGPRFSALAGRDRRRLSSCPGVRTGRIGELLRRGDVVYGHGVGEDLATIVVNSTKPCTLSVNPGTHNVPNGITIIDGITVRAPGGATLSVSSPASAAVAIGPAAGLCPSGATLEGFTLSGGQWGVLVRSGTGCPTRSDLRSDAAEPHDHGWGQRSRHRLRCGADLCHPLLHHRFCLCQRHFYRGGQQQQPGDEQHQSLSTTTQHGIAVQGSSDNVIVGNTISGASFDGILVNADPLGAEQLAKSYRAERHLRARGRWHYPHRRQRRQLRRIEYGNLWAYTIR